MSIMAVIKLYLLKGSSMILAESFFGPSDSQAAFLTAGEKSENNQEKDKVQDSIKVWLKFSALRDHKISHQ